MQSYQVVKIVSGGARGADKLGAQFATENNIPLVEFIPDWETFGKSAGYIRNRDIVKNADLVVAFWDGVSKGTKHAIDIAHELKKEVIVVNPNKV